MNKEDQLLKNIEEASFQYAGKVITGTQAELKALSEKVKHAKKELSDFICDGADPCPSCGSMPIGMIVRETQEGKFYEVGCVNCAPIIFDKDGNVATDKTPSNEKVRVSFSTRSFMPIIAVEKWNDKKYLRDKKF